MSTLSETGPTPARGSEENGSYALSFVMFLVFDYFFFSGTLKKKI